MTPARAQRVRLKAAEQAIAEAASDRRRLSRYRSYWRSITPRTDLEHFNRWLFSFASVQTGWQRNVLIYQALSAPGVRYDEASLRGLFVRCGAGLMNNRSKGVARLHADFREDPARFRPLPGESFPACRDRLVKAVHGLGIAKVAFVLEMAYPLECDVVCLDRHLLRLFGVDAERGAERVYRRAEDAWRRLCEKHSVPCALARHVYWDGVQGRKSTRYWSHCLEVSRGEPAAAPQAA